MGTNGLRQSPGKRAQLNTIWQAHPNVRALRADAEVFAQEEQLRWDAEGMTAVLRFAAARIGEVEWPHSGILIG